MILRLFVSFGLLTSAFAAAPGWPVSTPEAQGLDSQVLSGMLDKIAQKHLNVHSVTIIRHGNMVLDAYLYPFNAKSTHDAASVTKTITSVLVGIAIDRGLLKLDQKVLPLVSKDAPANPDMREQKITIADLLKMEPGLDCGFAPGEQELGAMKYTDNWVKYALALPMKYEPGTQYGYCSPGYHLLSAILTAVTHGSELEFARKALFDPLGITDVSWPPDPQGLTHGWGDSHLYPGDFAKIASLYLHDGKWKGKQIVSADWVHQSLTPHADQGRGNSFGYGWVLTKQDGLDEFGYNGRGGQHIAVWRDKDMVVIVTGAGYPLNEVMTPIVKSIRSDVALAANNAGDGELKARVAAVAQAPAATAPSELPAMAKSISGKTYGLPRNASRLDSLRLDFSSNREASLTVKYLGTDLRIPVGLDGVYRLGPYGPLSLLAGATGKWTTETDFLLDLNLIANINHYTVLVHFSDKQADLTISESSGLIRNAHVTAALE